MDDSSLSCRVPLTGPVKGTTLSLMVKFPTAAVLEDRSDFLLWVVVLHCLSSLLTIFMPTGCWLWQEPCCGEVQGWLLQPLQGQVHWQYRHCWRWYQTWHKDDIWLWFSPIAFPCLEWNLLYLLPNLLGVALGVAAIELAIVLFACCLGKRYLILLLLYFG